MVYFLSPLVPVGLDYYGMVQKILKLERLRSPAFKSGFTSPYQSYTIIVSPGCWVPSVTVQGCPLQSLDLYLQPEAP